jgi:hypothetical protein
VGRLSLSLNLLGHRLIGGVVCARSGGRGHDWIIYVVH